MCNFFSEESQEYFQIFHDIDRLDQLKNYYIRCHKVKCPLQLVKMPQQILV